VKSGLYGDSVWSPMGNGEFLVGFGWVMTVLGIRDSYWKCWHFEWGQGREYRGSG